MAAWRRGNPEPPLRPALEEHRSGSCAVTDDGRHNARVRFPELPMTEYAAMEFAWGCPGNVTAGEEINIVDRAEHPEFDHLREDFVVFDDAADVLPLHEGRRAHRRRLRRRPGCRGRACRVGGGGVGRLRPVRAVAEGARVTSSFGTGRQRTLGALLRRLRRQAGLSGTVPAASAYRNHTCPGSSWVGPRPPWSWRPHGSTRRAPVRATVRPGDHNGTGGDGGGRVRYVARGPGRWAGRGAARSRRRRSRGRDEARIRPRICSGCCRSRVPRRCGSRTASTCMPTAPTVSPASSTSSCSPGRSTSAIPTRCAGTERPASAGRSWW